MMYIVPKICRVDCSTSKLVYSDSTALSCLPSYGFNLQPRAFLQGTLGFMVFSYNALPASMMETEDTGKDDLATTRMRTCSVVLVES